MVLRLRSASPRGQRQHGEETDGRFCCPECEVVLTKDVRFSYALGILRSQGWHGHGCSHDGVEWTLVAARRGHVQAQRDLGLKYVAGLGVPRDYSRAYRWLNLAAAAGDTTARDARDTLQQRMTPDQVAEAQRLSSDWHERRRPPEAV